MNCCEHDKKQEIYSVLSRLNIPFTVIDHPAAGTMEECNAIGRQLGASICKNLFLCNRQKTKFYLLLMPGDKEFRTKNLSAQIGSSRLSFAAPEDMERLLNTAPGSASVLGLLYDRDGCVQLLIDRDLLKNEYFGCHPCINTSSVRFRTEDLLARFLPYSGHTAIYVTL